MPGVRVKVLGASGPGVAAEQVVVMGVSGSGKSTIGALIAQSLAVPFLDADGLHPQANIVKMASGVPLTDADRWPWLALVGQALSNAGAAGTGLVIACSALKRVYRDAIVAAAPQVQFVHLAGTLDVLGNRLEGRSEHFMPPALLRSQLATLEELQGDEPGFAVDIDQPALNVVTESVARLGAARLPASVGIGVGLGGRCANRRSAYPYRARSWRRAYCFGYDALTAPTWALPRWRPSRSSRGRLKGRCRIARSRCR